MHIYYFLRQFPICIPALIYIVLISELFYFRLKLQTGWKERLVEPVERQAEMSEMSTAHPVNRWPRMPSATPTPGFCLQTPAVIPPVILAIFPWPFSKRTLPAMQTATTQTMNIWHQTMHTYNTYLHLLHSSRVFHQAGICEAGEAGGLWRCGVQVLLCWACAAVPARLYPSENHYRQRWLSLPAQWWVARKLLWKTLSLFWYHVQSPITSLFSLLQKQLWTVLVWAASSRRASTWGILQKPTWPVAALLSVLELIAFGHMTFCFLF